MIFVRFMVLFCTILYRSSVLVLFMINMSHFLVSKMFHKSAKFQNELKLKLTYYYNYLLIKIEFELKLILTNKIKAKIRSFILN